MPTLHLVCGLPGAGKTTLAKALEHEGATVRLCPDEWMIALGADAYDAQTRETVEQLQWDLAQRLLALGVSVVLENGFWRREERDRYRARAAELGAVAKIHFLDVPRAELERRLVERNTAELVDSYRVSVADLDWMSAAFEAPTAGELVTNAGGA
jgi:hypothetical protein